MRDNPNVSCRGDSGRKTFDMWCRCLGRISLNIDSHSCFLLFCSVNQTEEFSSPSTRSSCVTVESRVCGKLCVKRSVAQSLGNCFIWRTCHQTQVFKRGYFIVLDMMVFLYVRGHAVSARTARVQGI